MLIKKYFRCAVLISLFSCAHPNKAYFDNGPGFDTTQRRLSSIEEDRERQLDKSKLIEIDKGIDERKFMMPFFLRSF